MTAEKTGGGVIIVNPVIIAVMDNVGMGNISFLVVINDQIRIEVLIEDPDQY